MHFALLSSGQRFAVSIKSGLANVMGFMQGFSTGPAADTVVKDGIT